MASLLAKDSMDMEIIHSKQEVAKHINEYELHEIISDKYVQYAQLHIFYPQEIILIEEEKSKYFYIMVEGEAKVAPSSENGKIALLDYIGSMDLLGDIEYFLDEPNYHNVIALTKCILLAIPFVNIEKHFNDNLDFYKFVSRSLAGKIKNSSVSYSRTLLYPVKNRLAKYLYDIAEYTQSNRVKLKFNQTAQYFGITPRHFRRILSSFENNNIIKRHNTDIEIIDMPALLRYSTYK